MPCTAPAINMTRTDHQSGNIEKNQASETVRGLIRYLFALQKIGEEVDFCRLRAARLQPEAAVNFLY